VEPGSAEREKSIELPVEEQRREGADRARADVGAAGGRGASGFAGNCGLRVKLAVAAAKTDRCGQ
jgi:hypothetical protein